MPFPDLRTWFGAALSEPAALNIMTVFELMELVIDFEVNRPYIYWYGGAEQMVKFDWPKYEEIVDRFGATRQAMTKPTTYDSALQLLADEISLYRDEIKKEPA